LAGSESFFFSGCFCLEFWSGTATPADPPDPDEPRGTTSAEDILRDGPFDPRELDPLAFGMAATIAFYAHTALSGYSTPLNLDLHALVVPIGPPSLFEQLYLSLFAF